MDGFEGAVVAVIGMFLLFFVAACTYDGAREGVAKACRNVGVFVVNDVGYDCRVKPNNPRG